MRFIVFLIQSPAACHEAIMVVWWNDRHIQWHESLHRGSDQANTWIRIIQWHESLHRGSDPADTWIRIIQWHESLHRGSDPANTWIRINPELNPGPLLVELKVKVWTLVIAPLTWVRLVTSSALQSRKWQLTGMSQVQGGQVHFALAYALKFTWVCYNSFVSIWQMTLDNGLDTSACIWNRWDRQTADNRQI